MGDPVVMTVPEEEIEAFKQVKQEFFESDEETAEGDMLLMQSLFEVLIEAGLVKPEVVERKYFQLQMEYDQESAQQRDAWIQAIRERCPTIAKHMDSHAGAGNWGPDDVRTQ